MLTKEKKKFFISLVGAALLAGCANVAKDMEEKGTPPLSAAEITALVSGNTIKQTGVTRKGTRWVWVGLYRSDGSAIGKSSWSGGEKVGSGIWEVSEDGLLCADWDDPNWGGGGYGCSRLYKDGDEFLYSHVRGSRGDYPEGTFEIESGNAYNL